MPDGLVEDLHRDFRLFVHVGDLQAQAHQVLDPPEDSARVCIDSALDGWVPPREQFLDLLYGELLHVEVQPNAGKKTLEPAAREVCLEVRCAGNHYCGAAIIECFAHKIQRRRLQPLRLVHDDEVLAIPVEKPREEGLARIEGTALGWLSLAFPGFGPETPLGLAPRLGKQGRPG